MGEIFSSGMTKGFGLMFYNARMYDPALGRFTSADSIIPSVQGLQAWDRFAYANNNPIYYTDPDGHFAIPAAVIAGVVILLKVVDYGWTAYDIVSAGSVYLDKDATQEMHDDATATIAMAIAFEAMEPDEVSPIALPIDDIVRHSDDAVDLYRAVSKAELADIMDTGIFRPNPKGTSMDTKWFWETYEGAQGWLQQKGLDGIVKATVPQEILEEASQRWDNLDQLGPASGFIDEGLDKFNNVIISIKKIWME